MADCRTAGEERTALDEMDAIGRATTADNYRVRCAALDDLARIGNDRCVAALCRALRDRRKQVRARAAQALARLGKPETLNALVTALSDQTSTVRTQAVDAIRKIAAVNEVIRLLSPMLTDPDVTVRQRAVRAFGSLRDPRVVQPLLAIATDCDAQLQQHIITALGPLRDLRTVLFLCRSVNGSARRESVLAARQLRAMGDIRSLPRALVRASNLSPNYRLAALEALRTVRLGSWIQSLLMVRSLPPPLVLCAHLAGADTEGDVRHGAAELLEWASLLRGSHAEPNDAELMRPVEGAMTEAASDALLRASIADEPTQSPDRGFWARLFLR